MMNSRWYQRSYRFCLNAKQSPTHFNISQYLQQHGWKYTNLPWLAHFTEQNLQFNIVAAQTLEFKHLLAQLVTRYCPSVMPETFNINDYNNHDVLKMIAERYYQEKHHAIDQVDELIWILKPSLQNNGQNIKIYERLSALQQHFLNPRRLGGEHVLQRYIHKPHLLNGHKYSIRLFVLMTNYVGSYLYRYGYFNVAKQAYQPQILTDLSSHLTNEHLRKGKADEANVIQIPTQRCEFFTPIYQQSKKIVAEIQLALCTEYPDAFRHQKIPTLAFFGYDFMVDDALRVWLLEINHGPCFPIHPEHILQQYLYRDFWQAVIAFFIQPIAQKSKKLEPKNELGLFDLIS